MQYLTVSYKEKDQAKKLGAKWNSEKKSWYIPDGLAITSFERWLPKHAGLDATKSGPSEPVTKSKSVVKSAGVEKVWPTQVGKHYFKIDHNCIPWEYCD